MISISRTDLGVVAVALLFSTQAHTQAAFQPTGLLMPAASQSLPAGATRFAMADAALYAIAPTPDGQSTVLRLSAETLAVEATASLPLAAADIAAAPGGGAFVIGTGAGETRLLSLDADLAQQASVVTERFANPSLEWTGPGLLALGSTGEDKLPGDFRLIDVTNPAAPALHPAPRPALAARGVSQGWFDAANQIVFLNLSGEPSLLAIDARTDRRVAGSGAQGKTAAPVEPFTVRALLAGARCDGQADPTFLISDRSRDRLMVVDYVGYFRALNLVTEAEPRLRLRPGTVAETLPGSSAVLRPSGLIASSCDRQVIWLGGLHSDEIIQYALNPAAKSLEKVGSITLPALPLALALAPDGQAGFVLLAGGQMLRFAAPPEAASSLIGNPEVRQLQRVLTEKGYPVGAIDGFLGERTKNAITQFKSQTGIAVDPSRDINGALGAIRGIGG